MKFIKVHKFHKKDLIYRLFYQVFLLYQFSPEIVLIWGEFTFCKYFIEFKKGKFLLSCNSFSIPIRSANDSTPLSET